MIVLQATQIFDLLLDLNLRFRIARPKLLDGYSVLKTITIGRLVGANYSLPSHDVARPLEWIPLARLQSQTVGLPRPAA